MEEALLKGKQIDLQTKKKDLEKIASGEKVEDYRAISRYNIKLLTTIAEIKGKKAFYDCRKDITHVRFVNGRGDKLKFAVCEISGIFTEKFVKFVPEGMKPGTKALTIYIRRVVNHNL